MRYAPKDLRPPPVSHGFTVERAYLPVDSPGDVSRTKDGTWVAKAGSRVKVQLTLVAPARRYHVALVDPLPAGLEPLNPALRGSQPPPPATPGADSSALGGRHFGRGHSPFMGRPFHFFMPWWWSGVWYEHQNLRDERAEAFSSLPWEGVHTYSYYARATTPGTFVVPPPKAEEMYFPETFGRGAGDRLVVQ